MVEFKKKTAREMDNRYSTCLPIHILTNIYLCTVQCPILVAPPPVLVDCSEGNSGVPKNVLLYISICIF